MRLTKSEYWHRLKIPISSAIRNASLMRRRSRCVLWCSMRMMEICSRKLCSTRRRRLCLRRRRFGKFLLAWCEVWKLFTICRFCIVISSRQMFFLLHTAMPFLAIWMSVKLLRKDLVTLKLVRHTMLLRKYGEMSRTIRNLIFGLWAVFCLRWLLWSRLLGLRTCKGCLRKLSRAKYRKFQRNLVRSSIRSSKLWLTLSRRSDLAAIKF